MDQSLTTTYNVIIIDEQSIVDWPTVVDDGVQAAIVRLSHGLTQDGMAKDNLANAKSIGLYVHGYHEFEGIDGEVEFSLENATAVGLPIGSFMFLKGAPDDAVEGFINNWLSVGWEVGATNAISDYYWAISNIEPDGDYAVWQFDDTHAYDATGNLTVDPVSPVPDADSFTPSQPEDGAYVGFGHDTTGLLGGQSFGYSTNGDNFYAVVTPFGIVFRQTDIDRIAKQFRLQSPKGTVFYLTVTDDGELKAVKKGDGA